MIRCPDIGCLKIMSAVPSVPRERGTKERRFLSMDKADETKKLRKARVIVSDKLRAYFAEMKAELDADNEDFFQRVMQQADRRQHTGMR